MDDFIPPKRLIRIKIWSGGTRHSSTREKKSSDCVVDPYKEIKIG